jgi:hypothetical protein
MLPHMPLSSQRLSLALRETLSKLRGTQSEDQELEEVRSLVLRLLAKVEVSLGKRST